MPDSELLTIPKHRYAVKRHVSLPAEVDDMLRDLEKGTRRGASRIITHLIRKAHEEMQEDQK